MKKVIGITGNIGAGKSVVSKYIESKGYLVYDVDKIGHQALQDEIVKKELINEFSENILIDGQINRKELSKIVFSNKSKLIKLNKITHPYIINKMKEIIVKNETVFFDIPLLFEMKLEYLFTTIICVYVTKEIQIERIMKRDNRDITQIENIIASQMPVEEKIKNSDYAIFNLSFEETKKEIDYILKRINEDK